MNLCDRYPADRLQLVLDASDALVLLDALTVRGLHTIANTTGVNAQLIEDCLRYKAMRHLNEQLVPDITTRWNRLSQTLHDWLSERP